MSQNEIVSETNYYPFGLAHKGYNEHVSSSNLGQNYKFNGKELNDEFGLNFTDFGWRNYMSDIGRWISPDPLMEEYPEWSPYNFTMNNPVRFTDVDGLYSTDEWMRDNGITDDDLVEVYNASDNQTDDTGGCCEGIGAAIKSAVMGMFGFADGDDIDAVAQSNPKLAKQLSEQNAQGAKDRNAIAQSLADGLAMGDLLGVATLGAGFTNGLDGSDAFNVAALLPLGKGLKAVIFQTC